MTQAIEPPKQASRAWEKGKLIFKENLKQTGKAQSENIERFLRNNFLLTTAISNCESLKGTAESKYNTKGTSRFVGKLLDILTTIKDVGDPFLSNGPETVSIAWCAVSTLITIAAKDKEDCDFISEACTNVVTIVLNCRLYERRYDPVTEGQIHEDLKGNNEEEKADTNLGDLERELRMALPRVIALVLEFAWYTQLRMNENRAVRIFKETFSPALREKYELLMAEYVKVRDFSQDAFQERVMNSATDLCNKIENLNRKLFPELKEHLEQLREENREIKAGVKQGLETGSEVKSILTESLLNQKFEQYRMKLKPKMTHETLFNTILRPIPAVQLSHLCQWLFENERYKSWEVSKISSGCATIDHELPDSVHMAEPAVLVTPSIFYIQGRPGFGKSVMMACAVRRLSRPDLEGALAYFFFKKGDDSSQRAENALSSIAAQLYHQHVALDRTTKEQFIKVMDDLALEAHKAQEKLMKKDENDKSSVENPRSPVPSSADINKALGSLVFTNQHLKKLIQEIGKHIRKTVFLVVDAIDECVDQQAEGLVPILVDIVSSPDSPFKVIMSTRENAEHEKYLATTADLDTTAESKIDGKEIQKHEDPFRLRLVERAVILTVTEDTNARDMKIFLESNLIKLITRSKENRKKPPGKKLTLAVSQIAEKIKMKANGMFTYSAMVIASLKQPSRMKLTERLRKLPDGMDELYRKRLGLLTGDERELAALTLKRIVFSFGPIRTLEIAEEFKQVYLENSAVDDDDKASDIAISYEDSECGSDIDGNEAIKQNLEVAGGAQRTHLKVPNTPHPQEKNNDLLLKAMQEPEIADTIFHLEHTGRDFFKFSLDKSTIDTIHKSIRDWVENESRQVAAELDQNAGSVASLFTWDEFGQLRLTLPIPSVFSKGHSGGLDFQSERETHLDILTYLLEVLTNTAFHEKYMPYYTAAEIGPDTPDVTDIPATALKHNEIYPRYEIGYWHKHLQRIQELWSVSDRKGEKWNRLKALMHKFVQPDCFRRWVIQYWRFHGNKTIEEAITKENDFSPIHIAGYWGLNILIEHIIGEEDCDVNARNGKGETVLHLRDSLYHPEIVKKVLDVGYDFSMTADQVTPIGEIVYALHQSEFDPDNKETQALLQSMKYLVEGGTNVNEKNSHINGDSLLHTIVFIGDKKLFDLLINHPKIDLGITNWRGETVLHTCLKHGSKKVSKEYRLSMLEALIKAGSEVNAQDNSSNGPLYFAVLARSVEGARLLLEQGADIEDDNDEGSTAITALSLGDEPWTTEAAFAMVQLLLSRGADIDAIDRIGNTALMLAVWNCKFELAELLMIKTIEKFGKDRSFLLRQNTYGEALLYVAGYMEADGLKAARFIIKHAPKEMYKTLLQQRSTKGDTSFENAVFSHNHDLALYYMDLVSENDIVLAGESSGKNMLLTVCRRFARYKFTYPEFTLKELNDLEALASRLMKGFGKSGQLEQAELSLLQHIGIMCGSEPLLRAIASSDNPLYLNTETDITDIISIEKLTWSGG